MSRIIIFCTGRDTEQLLLEIESRRAFYYDEIVAFSDNNPAKWGKKYHGNVIIPPADIEKNEYDIIVIASSNYFREIKESLMREYCLGEDKMVFWRAYLISINITFQYERSLKRNQNRPNRQPLNTSHTVVYTAIENDYDDLPEPLYTGEDIDYVCFTDNKELKSESWNIEYITPPADGNYAKDIRKYKFFPQHYFKEYETSIWIDANLQILRNLNELIREYSHGSSLLCFPHTSRKCIYEECGALIEMRKASPVELIKQSADYLADGYPENNGLYSGGVLVRNHHDEAVCKCMEDWWEEIQLHTLRDQMSMPYVLWKNQFEPDLCKLNLDENEFIRYINHKMGHWRTAR